MTTPVLLPVDPWLIEIVTVVGNSHSGAERRSISRDVERGGFLRLGRGAYVGRTAFESLVLEDQHIVRMRALVAVSSAPPLFSHWSAGVLHGLPVLRSRLAALHVVVENVDDRHRLGATAHLFTVDDGEVVAFGEVRATGVGRTVVDLAGASPFEEGVMAADGALASGVPRRLLEAAVDLAGPRRASRRIGDVVAFAHPGAESAAESRMRVTSMRIGVEVPVLQHRLVLRDGSSAFLDGFLPTARVGVEVDGEAKYFDMEMAPDGTARAVVAEKRREDEVRLALRGLLRIGWVQSGSTSTLRAAYARVGVVAGRARATFADYCGSARSARPRRPPRGPRWRT